ncbi:MAG: hypothetical protein AAF687_07425 [Pseudomonadota bacterium]
MEIHPQLVQFGGSLIAILALTAFAWWLKLGGKPALKNEMAVFDVANEVESGFDAQRISIGRGGAAALASDQEGRIMVIKRHGNQFAGRVLTKAASVREEVDGLIVDCGEARFGAVRLSLDDPAYWADAINRL